MQDNFEAYIDSFSPLTDEQLFPAEDKTEPEIKEKKIKMGYIAVLLDV